MAERLSREEIIRLEEAMDAFMEDSVDSEAEVVFKILDRNGDGKLQEEELRNIISQIRGPEFTEAGFQKWRRMFDIDGDGLIDLNEFITTLKKDRDNYLE